MTKTELISAVALKAELTKKDSEKEFQFFLSSRFLMQAP